MMHSNRRVIAALGARGILLSQLSACHRLRLRLTGLTTKFFEFFTQLIRVGQLVIGGMHLLTRLTADVRTSRRDCAGLRVIMLNVLMRLNAVGMHVVRMLRLLLRRSRRIAIWLHVWIRLLGRLTIIRVHLWLARLTCLLVYVLVRLRLCLLRLTRLLVDVLVRHLAGLIPCDRLSMIGHR
jgi:hypothetical protein